MTFRNIEREAMDSVIIQSIIFISIYEALDIILDFYFPLKKSLPPPRAGFRPDIGKDVFNEAYRRPV